MPSLLPDDQSMISHSHHSIGEFPKTTYIVEFDYPDCTRTFDGKHWMVIPKNAPATQQNDTGDTI